MAVTTLPIGLTSCAWAGSDGEPASASKRPKRPAIVVRPSIHLLLSRRAQLRDGGMMAEPRAADQIARPDYHFLSVRTARRLASTYRERDLRRQQNGAFPTAESRQHFARGTSGRQVRARRIEP